jgi:hypothetical protein
VAIFCAEVRREDELDRLGDEGRELARTVPVDAMGNERDDATGEGALEGLGQQRARRELVATGGEQPGAVVDQALVAGYAVGAPGERLVGEEIGHGGVGGGELKAGADRRGHLLRPCGLGQVGLFYGHLQAGEGRLEGVCEIVWVLRGVFHACVRDLVGKFAPHLEIGLPMSLGSPRPTNLRVYYRKLTPTAPEP